MKYICKKDLPFVKKGEEVEIDPNEISDRDLPNDFVMWGKSIYKWPKSWGNFLDWFEPKRWKPSKGQAYWIISFEQGEDGMSDVAISKHVARNTMNGMWAPCFPSLEQAEKARLLVIEALKKAHE